MKHTNRYLLIIFCGIFTYGEHLEAKENGCRLDFVTFTDKHLKCLRDAPIIRDGIKQSFLKIKNINAACQKCSNPFPDASKYTHLYKRDYFPIALGLNDFGGYYVYLLFKDDPMVYELWLYEVDDGEFQVRAFEPLQPHIKIKKKIPELTSSRRYSKYWSNAFIGK